MAGPARPAPPHAAAPPPAPPRPPAGNADGAGDAAGGAGGEAEGPRDGFHAQHIPVAERGVPWCEWLVALLALLSALLALCGEPTAGIVVLVALSETLGAMRLALRERSPWKVRSVAFDATINILFGLGLGAVSYTVLIMQ